MLPAKIAAVYIMLFRIIPRYLLQKRYIQLGWAAILVIFTLALVNLGSLYFLIYPIIYQESPGAGDFSVARIFWSLLDVTSVVGLATAFKLLRMRLESAEREKQLIEEKLQSELQFLRAQTNPHFLFNTLNNIYALARKKSDQTADVVLKLSKLLRFMLYECTKPEIPLLDELKVIKDYIELEKIRYNNRLHIDYQEEIDDASQPIAPLLLLPFVENAFKHGTSETRFETTIAIQIQLQNCKLDFYIKNSKDAEAESAAEGIGLRNVKRQLELLYPKKYDLLVEDKGTEFVVRLTIDVCRPSETGHPFTRPEGREHILEEQTTVI